MAGQEPEKTNVLLQNMFRAATAGIDTTPHVNRVLGLDDPEEETAQQEDPEEAAANENLEN